MLAQVVVVVVEVEDLFDSSVDVDEENEDLPPQVDAAAAAAEGEATDVEDKILRGNEQTNLWFVLEEAAVDTDTAAAPVVALQGPPAVLVVQQLLLLVLLLLPVPVLLPLVQAG